MRSAPPNVLALAALPSLGITSAQMLIDVGIKDEATLRAMGPESCFRSLRFHFGRRVSINFIYALECAVRGIGWKMLEPGRKAALRAAARRIVHDLETG
jgi:DNA transformation protein